MNQWGKFSFKRFGIWGAASALALFNSTPIFAQQKPIVIEPGMVAAAAVKALTVINKSGSYVLNRNITNSRAGFDAVLVTAPNVTIDLQGFSILCTAPTTGNGINATGQSNVVIRNGTITSCGGAAIVTGNNGSISAITATGNGSGITCGIGCLASGNVIQGNAGLGLTFTDTTSGYVGNVLLGNNNGGAQVSGGTSLNQNVCNGAAC
jgi:hypothetical protein